MRILFCNYEYPPLGGGGGVINALIAQELAKSHDVTVLTSQGLGACRQSVEHGVQIVRVPVYLRRHAAVANLSSMFAFMIAGVQAGKKLMTTQQFDVINTHFVLPTGPVGQALARVGGIPNILSLHGGDLYDPSKFLSPHRHALTRLMVRKLLRQATAVVGQSNNTLENMRRFYTPEIQGMRIPLAIRRPPPDVAARAAYGFTDDDLLLVTVGRLIPRKATQQLITMMQGLRHRAKRAHLLVIGAGPEEQTLKALAQEKRVSEQVHFLGFVAEEEKMRLLHMCDLYVSTSQHEGFGLVFLESMACGLPIVCYNHGGQTDFLQDGETGYLTPLNDLDDFTKRCLTLIQQPHLRHEMGNANQQRAEEFFIDTCAQKYEAVFHQVIQAHKKGQRLWTLQGAMLGSD